MKTTTFDLEVNNNTTQRLTIYSSSSLACAHNSQLFGGYIYLCYRMSELFVCFRVPSALGLLTTY